MRRGGVLTERDRAREAWITPRSSGATYTVDARLGSKFRFLLDRNAVLEIVNGSSGQRVTIRLEQDDVGSRSVTLSGGFVVRGEPTTLALETAAGSVTVLECVYDDVARLWEVLGARDLSGLYDAAGTATSAVANHEAAGNPHPVYLTQAEGDALYGPLSGATQLLAVNTSHPAGNTIANTAAETAFDSKYTIPGNSLAVGQVLRVTLRGFYSTDVVAPTLIGRLRFGGVAGTVLLTTGTISALVGGVSALGWAAEILVVVHSIGATGTLEVQGTFQFATAATAALTVIPSNGALVTVDTTADKDLVATATWGTADADNTVTLRQFAVQRSRAA